MNVHCLHLSELPVTTTVIRNTINGTPDVFLSFFVEKVPVVGRSPVQGIMLYTHYKSCAHIKGRNRRHMHEIGGTRSTRWEY
jgi:hypothetical protein